MNRHNTEKALKELLGGVHEDALAELRAVARTLAGADAGHEAPKATRARGKRPLGLLAGKARFSLAEDFRMSDEELLGS